MGRAAKSRTRVGAGAATFAALLAAWTVGIAPRLPATKRAPLDGVRRFVWIGPGHGGHWSNEDPWQVDVLAVGDSRAGTGFDPHAFEEAGFGEATVLWGGSALIVDLVNFAATDTDASSVVVSLTPRSLCFETDGFLRELLSQRPLPARPAPGELEPTLNEVRTWERSLEEEIGPARYAAVIESLAGGYHAEGARRGVWSAAIDARLRADLGRVRQSWVRTADPAVLHKAWVRGDNPRASDDDYRRNFEADGAGERAAAALRDLTTALHSAVAAGKRVACVRLPVSPSLRAIEDAFIDPSALGKACAEAGVPFLDLETTLDGTLDGSHLNGRAQVETSRMIARWLSTDHGW